MDSHATWVLKTCSDGYPCCVDPLWTRLVVASGPNRRVEPRPAFWVELADRFGGEARCEARYEPLLPAGASVAEATELGCQTSLLGSISPGLLGSLDVEPSVRFSQLVPSPSGHSFSKKYEVSLCSTRRTARSRRRVTRDTIHQTTRASPDY